MVSFVKPNLLGTSSEFNNRFVNPINNGQHKDSTEVDVRVMKKRAHVLHNMLDHCVQRKDYDVIIDHLPPKHESVLSVRLSAKPIELYNGYMCSRNLENGFTKRDMTADRVLGAQLFADFHEFSRISSHPWTIKINELRVIRNEKRAAEKEAIDENWSPENVKPYVVKPEPDEPSPTPSESLDDDNVSEDDDIIALDAPVKQKR